MGDAAGLPLGDRGRAPGLPRGSRGVRRQPPGHRPGRRPGRVRPSAEVTEQRPAPDLGRPGAVHPSLGRDRVGGGRHHRVVARRGAFRRHAQRVQHEPGGGGHRGGRYDQRAGHHRRAGPRGARPPGRGVRGGGVGASLPRGPLRVGRLAVCGGGHRVHRRGRGGVCRPLRSRRGVLGGRTGDRGDARWSRGPRHPPSRSGPAPARARARTGHHPAPGRAGLGHRLGQGRLHRPGRLGGGAGHRTDPARCAAWWPRAVSRCGTEPRCRSTVTWWAA